MPLSKSLVIPKKCVGCKDLKKCLIEHTLGIKCTISTIKKIAKLLEKGDLSCPKEKPFSKIEGFQETTKYFDRQHEKGFIITSHKKKYRNTTLDNF